MLYAPEAHSARKFCRARPIVGTRLSLRRRVGRAHLRRLRDSLAEDLDLVRRIVSFYILPVAVRRVQPTLISPCDVWSVTDCGARRSQLGRSRVRVCPPRGADHDSSGSSGKGCFDGVAVNESSRRAGSDVARSGQNSGPTSQEAQSASACVDPLVRSHCTPRPVAMSLIGVSNLPNQVRRSHLASCVRAPSPDPPADPHSCRSGTRSVRRSPLSRRAGARDVASAAYLELSVTSWARGTVLRKRRRVQAES